MSMESLGVVFYLKKLIGGAVFISAIAGASVCFANEDSVVMQLVLSRPDVIASKLNIKKQEKLLKAEIAKKAPQVLAQGVSQGVVSEDGDLPSRANSSSNEYTDGSLVTTYSLFDSGVNKLNADIQSDEIMLAKYDYFLTINNRFKDIVPALLDRAESERKIGAIQKILDVIRKFDSVAERRFKSGVASIQEVRRIKLALVNTELALQEAEIQLRKADSKLIESYGFEIVDLQEAIQDLDDLISRAESMVKSDQFEQSISVLRVNQQIKQLSRMAELRVAQNSLQVETNLEAKRYGVGRDSASSDVVGRITVSLPLFDGGSTRYTEDAYDFDIQSKQNFKSNLISESRDLVKSLSLDLQSEADRLVLLMDKSENVESQIKEKLARYGQVEVDVAGLVDLTSDSLDTEIALIGSEFRTRLLRQEILAKMEIWPLLLQP